MWKLASALFLAGVVSAQVRSVCLEDRVGLNPFVRGAFEAEIRKLAPELAFVTRTCKRPAISLIVSAHAPARYANALGLARRNGERVFPELYVYQESVRRIIGHGASAVQLGRALARVVAHELGHYLQQETDHKDKGLMRASFETAQLASEDSAPFQVGADR